MPRETPSPIDLPDAPLEAAGLGWTAGVIVVASLFLLVANAFSIRDWADDLAPSPVQARVSAVAEQWVEVTDAAGVGAARAWLHGWWKAAEAARLSERARSS